MPYSGCAGRVTSPTIFLSFSVSFVGAGVIHLTSYIVKNDVTKFFVYYVSTYSQQT